MHKQKKISYTKAIKNNTVSLLKFRTPSETSESSTSQINTLPRGQEKVLEKEPKKKCHDHRRSKRIF